MNITPVMFTDSTGRSWIEDLWKDFLGFLNSVPSIPFTIPSFDQTASVISNIFGGALFGIVEVASNTRITRGFGYGSFEKLTIFFNKTSKILGKALIIVPLVLDIGNTLTENNNNTIWQRLVKSGVIILETAIITGTSYIGTSLIASGFASANPIAIIGGAAVMVGGVAIAEVTSSAIYEWLDIE